MHPLIEARRDELADLCRRYHVARLDLFGSAATGDFDAETSDLDFLVAFAPERKAHAFDDYFGLLEGLKDLFGRPVDLITSRSRRNPYFIEAANEGRQVLYAA